MRVILDTNILISALIFPQSGPGQLIEGWYEDRFELLTCEEQLVEVRRVSRQAKVQGRFPPSMAGKLVNDLRHDATFVMKLPRVDISPDPWDNYLLALAQAGRADFLVTGDKAGLLAIGSYATAAIVTVRELIDRL